MWVRPASLRAAAAPLLSDKNDTVAGFAGSSASNAGVGRPRSVTFRWNSRTSYKRCLPSSIITRNSPTVNAETDGEGHHDIPPSRQESAAFAPWSPHRRCDGDGGGPAPASGAGAGLPVCLPTDRRHPFRRGERVRGPAARVRLPGCPLGAGPVRPPVRSRHPAQGGVDPPGKGGDGLPDLCRRQRRPPVPQPGPAGAGQPRLSPAAHPGSDRPPRAGAVGAVLRAVGEPGPEDRRVPRSDPRRLSAPGLPPRAGRFRHWPFRAEAAVRPPAGPGEDRPLFHFWHRCRCKEADDGLVGRSDGEGAGHRRHRRGRRDRTGTAGLQGDRLRPGPGMGGGPPDPDARGTRRRLRYGG